LNDAGDTSTRDPTGRFLKRGEDDPNNVDNVVGDDERTRCKDGYDRNMGVGVGGVLITASGDIFSGAKDIKTSRHPSRDFWRSYIISHCNNH
jgi:hypothetical protein